MRKGLYIVLVIVIILVGCNSEEKKVVEEAKRNFRIVYDYEEDKLRPVIENEMTEEELAKKYLLTRLGLEEDEPTYKERGVLENQGIFVESAIYDGGSIPNVTPMSKETAENIRQNREDRSLAKKEEEFKELMENRKKVIEVQYDTDNTGIKELEEEIKRKVIEMEQDNTEKYEDKDVEIEYEG